MPSVLIHLLLLTGCVENASPVDITINNENSVTGGCCSCEGGCDSEETDTGTEDTGDSDSDTGGGDQGDSAQDDTSEPDSGSDTGVDEPRPDADGDGFPSYEDGGTDCDDTDTSVNPEVAEICGDGIDNDCDGAVDEDDDMVWYEDADADGYGNAAIAVSGCEAPGGYVADDTDCDDADAQINPGATELCDDGIDNDCDGLVDAADDCA